jgi:hypothetical protein
VLRMKSISSCCRSVFLCLALLLCASAAILATGSYCSLRPSDVGIPEFRMMPPGGVVPVLWPNGNPPRGPRWPLVGVVGAIAINESGMGGPSKPPNWCGTPSPGDPDWLLPMEADIIVPGSQAGSGKPRDWCGTQYIWTGPPPKSPKELILTPVIPRPR